ncbi:hypothetical protein CEXT_720141 [Caerostris extrusa]|uniref:Uncharacterized protein n=1 Tax=Caerostris extrusa TaxID=172846 RepID=A0AAV4SZI1_CAEEX|nr:hypothetical protein CEXT_720141 [Caerostris extrusa]
MLTDLAKEIEHNCLQLCGMFPADGWSVALSYIADRFNDRDTHLYSTPYKFNPIPFPNDFKGCVGGDSWMNRSQWGARHVLRGREKEGVYPFIIRTKGSMRKSSIRRDGGLPTPEDVSSDDF